MNRKHINVSGKELSYFDNETQGFPLILLHGNSLSASLFKNQFEGDTLKKYRLIAPELPGHGNSTRSSNPENDYGVMRFISILKAFIDKLSLKEFALFGHSLGGHIAINLLPHFNNCKGFIALGTPPLKSPSNPHEAFLPSPFVGLGFKPDLTDEEKRMLAAGFLAEIHPELDSVIEAISNADPLVRSYIGKSITDDKSSDETAIIKNKGKEIKIALLAGENDKLINLSYIESLSLPLWKDTPLILKNGSHSAFIDLPLDFNALIASFLEDL